MKYQSYSSTQPLYPNMPEMEAFCVKPKPKSAFSEGECATPDELSKISFTSSPLNLTSPGAISNDDKDALSPKAKRDIFNSSGISKELYSFLPNGTAIPIVSTSDSRQGRDRQRFDTCKDTGTTIRLTTGCIPITNDGRILFCSSSKKKEWILPKGGWENDENIEESAVRETYEEAGVLGTLGARLDDVTFETNKEKKRRAASLQLQTHDSFLSSDPPQAKEISENSELNNASSSTVKKTHGLVRVTFFVIYISEVLEEWPESGRSRKILDIEEAISIVKRDELKTVLLDLKARGLHNTNKKT